MKVLYLDHPESDYGSAFLFDGLNCVFGSEDVFDYPKKLSYHGKVHLYSTSQIQNGMTGPLAWMPNGYPENFPELDDAAYQQQIRDMLKTGEFGLVVLGSMREGAMQAFTALEQEIREANIPIVVHCGEDSEGLDRSDLSKLDQIRPKLILKREVPASQDAPGVFNGAKVVPFTFSCPKNAVRAILDANPTVSLGCDAAFLLGRTHDKRQEVADALRNAQDLHTYVSLSPDMSRNLPNETLLPWHDYMSLMLRSRCGISVRGHGIDTCHSWETPAMTVMVRDRLDLRIPNDFSHGVNCMLYDSADECVQHVRTLKQNPDLRQELRSRGFEHLMKYHTTEARVRYMMEFL